MKIAAIFAIFVSLSCLLFCRDDPTLKAPAPKCLVLNTEVLPYGILTHSFTYDSLCRPIRVEYNPTSVPNAYEYSYTQNRMSRVVVFHDNRPTKYLDYSHDPSGTFFEILTRWVFQNPLDTLVFRDSIRLGTIGDIIGLYRLDSAALVYSYELYQNDAAGNKIKETIFGSTVGIFDTLSIVHYEYDSRRAIQSFHDNTFDRGGIYYGANNVTKRYYEKKPIAPVIPPDTIHYEYVYNQFGYPDSMTLWYENYGDGGTYAFTYSCL